MNGFILICDVESKWFSSKSEADLYATQMGYTTYEFRKATKAEKLAAR